MICRANQLTDFFMRATLTFNGLNLILSKNTFYFGILQVDNQKQNLTREIGMRFSIAAQHQYIESVSCSCFQEPSLITTISA